MQLTLHTRDDDNSWEKSSLKFQLKLMGMGILSCYLSLNIVDGSWTLKKVFTPALDIM